MLKLVAALQCVLALGACAQEKASTGAAPDAPVAVVPADLRTVAEKSEFRATSRYEDVVSLMDRLAAVVPEGCVWSAPFVKLGSSFTLVMVMVNAFSKVPPLPSLACTRMA